MKNYSNGSDDSQQVVERVDHSFNWKLLILIVSLIAVIFYWPSVYNFISGLTVPTRQVGIQHPSTKNEQGLPDTIHPATFEEKLDAALRYDREGKRKQAEALFRELLMQAVRAPGYTKQMAILFPRAADFFSKGDEIPAVQVENLYLDAIDAIKLVYGMNHYDFENVYRGLEKHYLSQGRYKEAALQTKLLLEFYKRYHKDNKDTQYALIQPTTVRYGNNLLAAGQNTEARNAYQAALEMARSRGQSVSAIEALIKKTYQPGETIPSTTTDTQKIPASIGANIPAATPAPSTVDKSDDIKSAIESISMDGIYIEGLLENDKRVNINGYADDNKTVAKYMRLIQRDIGEPVLEWVKREEREQKSISAFSITIKK